jgi:hypothetical protein
MQTIEEMNTILREKMMRMHVAPEEMYRNKTDLYSKFDTNGVPTHEADGKEISKSLSKKLQKEWEKQKRLYEGRNEFQ